MSATRTRRAGAAVAALVAVSGGYLLWRVLEAPHAERDYRILVTGRIEESTTGDALEGVWVVPMRSMSDAALGAAASRKRILQRAYATGHRLIGGARTDTDGSFSLVFRISYVPEDDADADLPPFHNLEGLLIESDDGRVSARVSTASGAWTKVPPEKNVHAILEMRTVRVRIQ